MRAKLICPVVGLMWYPERAHLTVMGKLGSRGEAHRELHGNHLQYSPGLFPAHLWPWTLTSLSQVLTISRRQAEQKQLKNHIVTDC